MVLQAARAISDRFRALGELGAYAIAHLRRTPIAAALVFCVALAWLGAAGWWNYVRPQDFDAKAYEHYQEDVAKCRELRTSEARYDCVARAMIDRDHANFGTAMFVFLPPIILVFGHYLWREIRSNMREREHARRAEERSRRQLSTLRKEMIEDHAAAKAAQALVADAKSQHEAHRGPSDPDAARHHGVRHAGPSIPANPPRHAPTRT
jgi:hypothetical protein